jgi:hypothetical protein
MLLLLFGVANYPARADSHDASQQLILSVRGGAVVGPVTGGAFGQGNWLSPNLNAVTPANAPAGGRESGELVYAVYSTEVVPLQLLVSLNEDLPPGVTLSMSTAGDQGAWRELEPCVLTVRAQRALNDLRQATLTEAGIKYAALVQPGTPPATLQRQVFCTLSE